MARTRHLVTVSLIAGGLWACSNGSKNDEPAVNNGLANLIDDQPPVERQLPTAEAPFDTAEYAAQFDALDIKEIIAAQRGGPAPSAASNARIAERDGAHRESWLTSLSTDPGTAIWTSTARNLATMQERLIEPTWRAIVNERQRVNQTPQQQIAAHVEAIAEILRANQVNQETDIGRLMALSAMEAVRPGTLDETVDPLELELLRPEVRSTLEAVRTVVAAHAHTGLASNSEPVDVSQEFLAAADRVWESKPMNIRFATLAKRVVGFGRYEPFESSSFVAGRPQRMIVYTEIDNFAHRAFRRGDVSNSVDALGAAWTVEVSQELRLFRDKTFVWGKPEQTIVETSRNRRRDFYLVHQIELPPTLTVGPYELKIIMRDRTSGEIDEQIIPFHYVADYAATRAE